VTDNCSNEAAANALAASSHIRDTRCVDTNDVHYSDCNLVVRVQYYFYLKSTYWFLGIFFKLFVVIYFFVKILRVSEKHRKISEVGMLTGTTVRC